MGHNSVISGHPKSTGISRVDGLSMGPLDLGVSQYVATDMAKVKKFEDCLKLSIQGKIVGLLLQDMDLMVKTTMAIDREVDECGCQR